MCETKDIIVMNYAGKGKVSSVLNQEPRHENVSGSGGIAPLILNLGTRWRGPGRFTLEENAPGIHWIWGWVDSRACMDTGGGEKNPSRESNPGRPAPSTVTILTAIPG
jgi:hypothetical protein